MEEYKKISQVKCPKCQSKEVEQIGAGSERYIFKCLNSKCNTIWGQPKDGEKIKIKSKE
jgi:ribosomal protein L37AE/L43A